MDATITLSSQMRHHLRSLRKKQGLTQAELARRLGVVQSRIADIEKNPGSVSLDQYLTILAVLGAQLVIRDSQPSEASAASSETTGGSKSTSPVGKW